MNSNLTVVLSSAVVATFNPSLLAAVTIMLLLPQRKRLMLGYLVGAYTTSIIAGLVIVFALHQSGAVTTSKRTISPGEDIAIGGLVLAIALVLITGADAPLRRWHERHKTASARHRSPKPSWQERMLGKGSAWITFIVGAALSFPGVSYLRALDHIVKLNPPTVAILLLVLFFCVMQQILLELPLLAYLVAPGWTQDHVVRFKAWLGRHGRRIGEIALATVGIFLATRGLMAIS
jgi:Sap, sulfolipid-1-addressing protein